MPPRHVDVAVAVPVAERPAPPPDVWRLQRLVPVRITSAEERDVLFVTVDGTRHALSRRNASVVVDGGAPLPYATFDGAELEHEGRTYAGRLVVAAHPEQGLRLENWVDVESYVEGVVASEVALWSAPPAFLEAQAIAARSYALGTLERRARDGRAFLQDGVLDQAYRGRFRPDAAGRARGLDARLRDAVTATRGRVLSFGGRVADARFHASCGGHTASGLDVFGPEAPPGGTALCAGCRADSAWSVRLDAADLGRAAESLGLDSLGVPYPTRTDPTGRWLEVELRGTFGVKPLSALELRRAIGWDRMKSTYVLSWRQGPDGGAEIVGRGRGHGVGLCQEGARDLAERGYDAVSILAHYYPGLRVGVANLGAPAPAR
ncbi:MAG: SpoIID/LytB domain-containing protein [Planctomycetota bacterium]